MSNQPNFEENQIIKCLRLQGFQSIRFEPDGNVPPDLLVDNNVAVEVRRLNQNQITEDGFKGLEQEDYSLKSFMKTVLEEVSDPSHLESAFVGYSFKRPLPEKKRLKKEIKNVLSLHKMKMSESRTYNIENYLEISVFPSVRKLDKQFESVMSSDGDSGGFVVGLIHQNLDLIISEKEEKIKTFKAKYSKWWLAVVDTIGYGLDELDYKQFRELPKLQFRFDRILLVSPLDASNYRYLYE